MAFWYLYVQAVSEPGEPLVLVQISDSVYEPVSPELSGAQNFKVNVTHSSSLLVLHFPPAMSL